MHITRNLAIDALRRRRAESAEPDVLSVLVAPTDTTSVEDTAVNAICAPRVRS